jgi:YHS domain-containing protein
MQPQSATAPTRSGLATVLLLAAATLLATGAGPAHAGGAVNTGYFGGVAIMGYDPVAYFTEGRPVRGSEELAYEWLGTPWHFATREHRELFIEDPIRYTPQYGGFCVGEVAANGVTINIDPDAWAIIDGKLYLGYDKGFASEFASRPEEYLVKAEANWPELKARLEQGSAN